MYGNSNRVELTQSFYASTLYFTVLEIEELQLYRGKEYELQRWNLDSSVGAKEIGHLIIRFRLFALLQTWIKIIALLSTVPPFFSREKNRWNYSTIVTVLCFNIFRTVISAIKERVLNKEFIISIYSSLKYTYIHCAHFFENALYKIHVLYILNFIWSPRNECRMFRMFTADMHYVKVNCIRVHTREARAAKPKSLRLSCAHCQLLRRSDYEPYNTGFRAPECYVLEMEIVTLFTKNAAHAWNIIPLAFR